MKQMNVAIVDIGTHTLEDKTYSSREDFEKMLASSGHPEWKLVEWIQAKAWKIVKCHPVMKGMPWKRTPIRQYDFMADFKTLEDATEKVNQYGGIFIDENGFRWNLKVVEY